MTSTRAGGEPTTSTILVTIITLMLINGTQQLFFDGLLSLHPSWTCSVARPSRHLPLLA